MLLIIVAHKLIHVCVRNASEDSFWKFAVGLHTWVSLAAFVAFFLRLDHLHHVETDQNCDRQQRHQQNHNHRVLRSFCLNNFCRWTSRFIVCKQKTCPYAVTVAGINNEPDMEPGLRVTGHRVSDFGRVGSVCQTRCLTRFWVFNMHVTLFLQSNTISVN